MIYDSGEAYLNAPEKAVAVFGMSGLGKTTMAMLLRGNGDWFHYSVDYRIGTRYMDEHIADNFKLAAMQVPLTVDKDRLARGHVTDELESNHIERDAL